MSEWLFDDLRDVLVPWGLVFEASEDGTEVYLRRASTEQVRDFLKQLEKKEIEPER